MAIAVFSTNFGHVCLVGEGCCWYKLDEVWPDAVWFEGTSPKAGIVELPRVAGEMNRRRRKKGTDY